MNLKTTLSLATALATALAIGSGSTYLAVQPSTEEIPGLVVFGEFSQGYRSDIPWTTITYNDGQADAGIIKGYRQANGDSVVCAFYDPARAELRLRPTHSLIVRQPGVEGFDVWLAHNPTFERLGVPPQEWAFWHLDADTLYGTISVLDSCDAFIDASTLGAWE